MSEDESEMIQLDSINEERLFQSLIYNKCKFYSLLYSLIIIFV